MPSTISEAFRNLGRVNAKIEKYNTSLSEYVKSIFSSIKKRHQTEFDVLTSIGIELPSASTHNNELPIRKKIVKGPEYPKVGDIPPSMAAETYKSIIDTIYTHCKEMEKLPNMWQGLGEVGLRDNILVALRNTYKNVIASGETFNCHGKTDICVKAPSGENVFIAECKIWGGQQVMIDAISQLYGYLTVRDTKCALILFITKKGFDEYIEKAQEIMCKHPSFVRIQGNHGNSSFSYKMRHPNGHSVYMELMMFHFPIEIV